MTWLDWVVVVVPVGFVVGMGWYVRRCGPDRFAIRIGSVVDLHGFERRIRIEGSEELGREPSLPGSNEDSTITDEGK